VDYLATINVQQLSLSSYYLVMTDLHSDSLITTAITKEIYGEISGDLKIVQLIISFVEIDRPLGIDPAIFHAYADKLESPEWGFKCTRHSAIECEKNSTDDKYKFTWLSTVPGAEATFAIDNLKPFE
jgi:hypothetical protein